MGIDFDQLGKEAPIKNSESNSLEKSIAEIVLKNRDNEKCLKWIYRIKNEVLSNSDGISLLQDVINDLPVVQRRVMKKILHDLKKYEPELTSDEMIDWICDKDRMKDWLKYIGRTQWLKKW